MTHDAHCDPQVLYSVAESGYFGYLALRGEDGNWDTHLTPDPMATGNLVYDARTEATQIVVDDGAFGLHLSVWDGRSLIGGPDPVGTFSTRGAGIMGTGQGELALGGINDASEVQFARFDGAWTVETAGDIALAVSAGASRDGVAHFAFWYPFEGGGVIWSRPDSGDRETAIAVDAGSMALSQTANFVSVIGPGGGTPYVVTAVPSSVGNLNEIVLAQRLGPDAWSLQSIVAEDPLINETCAYQPTFEGEMCHYNYLRVRPLGLVTSEGGDVRVLYAEDHFIGRQHAICNEFPFPGCRWGSSSDRSVFSTRIAGPRATGVEHTLLFDDRRIAALDTSLDSNGEIHIAAYVDASEGWVVHYLRLGAP